MEVYDRNKIGKLIAWVGDHFVYEYGSGEVIKFSKFDFFLGYERALAKAADDFALCKKYFGHYLLETRVVVSGERRWVGLIQARIQGRNLKARDLQDASILDQYRDIIASYHTMTARENTFLDLIGQKGAWTGTVSNIFVTPENELILFDATLFDVHEFPLWQRPIFFPIFLIGRLLQDMTLRRFERSCTSSQYVGL